MRILYGLMGLLAAYAGPTLSAPTSAHAACGPDKLGTSRTLVVKTDKFRSIRGDEKSFGLRPKEVILTFDDGPLSGKTTRILKTLSDECVKATFFYVGRMARANPALVRRVIAQGHTLGHHTHGHNRLTNHSSEKAGVLIDRGIKTLEEIAYGSSGETPRVPFFRYPYLARSKRTDTVLRKRGLIAFDANIDSLDWKKVSGDEVHNRIMRRLRQEGKGIILMHDIQNRTAKMLPRLLRSLKTEGYRVVHIVPAGRPQPQADPVVVAALSEPAAKVEPSSTPVETKAVPQNTTISKEAGTDEQPQDVAAVKAAALQPVSLSKPVEVSDVKAANETSRAGVQRARPSIKKPADVAALETEQLISKKPSRKVAKKTPASKSRGLKVIAGEGKTEKTARKVVRKRKIRRNKITVASRGWKLRRSRWIIR